MSLPIKIELPSGFLDAECRCGYPIPEKLKRVWAVELDLVSEFSRVCEKHDIRWSVAFGTLIGAVRHRGFIPWDDDIDVMLERTEFEKLVRVASKEFTHPYFFQYALSDRKVFTPLARLRNSETTGYVSGYPKEGYNNGIYLDVYCFDANPQSRPKYLWKHFLKRCIGKMMNVYYQESAKDKSFLQRCSFAFKPLFHVVSYEQLWKWYCSALSLYNDSEQHYSHMLTAALGGRKDWVCRHELSDIVSLPYEFIKVPVIRSYDGYLRLAYGDYLQFPPVEQRGKWHEGQISFEPDIPYERYFASSDRRRP